MKKGFLMIGLVLCAMIVAAQVPQAFSYQAVIRDGDGLPVEEQNVSMRFSVIQDNASGPAVYVETHTTTTNPHGLVNLGIGDGTVVTGDFQNIAWGGDDYFLKVEVDADGGTNYLDMGTTQLLSVPYAMTARNAANAYWQANQNNIYYQAGSVGIGTQVVADGSDLNVSDKMAILDNDEMAQVMLGATGNGGVVETFDPDGAPLTVLSSNLGYGAIGTFDLTGNLLTSMFTTQFDDGAVGTFDPSGQILTVMSADDDGTGIIMTFDPSGLPLTQNSSSNAGSGWIGTYGINAEDNCRLTYLSGYPNHGYVSAHDEDGDEQAGIYVNAAGQGVVYADVKNLRMEYPGRGDQEIWYACIEGPEAAAYLRGTAQLNNGKATIDFTDHFKHVVTSENMTVMLTPLSAHSKGLAVTEKRPDGFTVVELLEGSGSYAFDWEVKAVRKGYENYRVVRDKAEAMPGEGAPATGISAIQAMPDLRPEPPAKAR